jgi:hypothetical protein
MLCREFPRPRRPGGPGSKAGRSIGSATDLLRLRACSPYSPHLAWWLQNNLPRNVSDSRQSFHRPLLSVCFSVSNVKLLQARCAKPTASPRIKRERCGSRWAPHPTETPSDHYGDLDLYVGPISGPMKPGQPTAALLPSLTLPLRMINK